MPVTVKPSHMVIMQSCKGSAGNEMHAFRYSLKKQA